MYQERFYRNQVLSKFKAEISYKESDLLICSSQKIDSDLAKNTLIKYYTQIEDYLKKNPKFKTSLSPLEADPKAPQIIKEMIKISQESGIGPFASVAGAVAFYVGGELIKENQELVIENGGDIFAKINQDKIIGVYLGERFKIPILNLKIKKRNKPFGVASSSSVIGESLNFGKADLVMVVAVNSIIADSYATALSNEIKTKKDIDRVLSKIKKIPSVQAILIAFNNELFFWGDLELSG